MRVYKESERTYHGCPGILAPDSFWDAYDNHPQMLDDVANDCGAKITGTQAWYVRYFYFVLKFFINTMWFLNVSPVCRIHDWGYYVGVDEEDRKHYDHMMMDNFMIWILYKSSLKLFVYPRNLRAMSFYTMVRAGGSDAFWEGKDK